VDVLEQLRLLTNLETNQRKLLQIILLGQPELLTLLARPELRQLSQRVTARFHLDALTHNEVVGYIQHRLGIAGAKGQLFPLKTVNRIYKITKGIPRLINLVCDRALLGTYVQNRLQVDVKTVNQAALEVLGSSQQNPRWKLPAVAASIIMLIAAGYFSQANTFVQDEPDNEPTAAATGPAPETQNQVADLSTQAAPPINKPDEQHPAEISSTNPEFSVFEGPVSFITGLVTPIAEIDSINSIQGYKLKNEVFAELFRLWGTEVVLGPGVDPCSVAASSGLQCLSRLGSLRDISHNNRPAIVYLPIEDEKGFFLVTDINDTSVSLAANSKTFQLEKDEFLYNWNGRYTMLWLTPPAYVGPSKPGDTGETIDWLYKHLSAIDDKSRTNTGKPFGDDLERKIKRFQMSVGLVPDGIVGVQTWIHLNNRYRTGIPTMHTDVKS
jgi:general secretion pathway protein A